MSQKDIGNKLPIYKLKAGKEVEDYYDKWTKENKYDKDMFEWKYSGPQETINLFKKYNTKKDIKILDAGCGTGLVGLELKKNGFTNIDGVDFSQKILTLAIVEIDKLTKIHSAQPVTAHKFYRQRKGFNMASRIGLHHVVGVVKQTFMS